jgi:hypothetical protein
VHCEAVTISPEEVTMLPRSVIDTYHRELTEILRDKGVDAFRIGGGERLPYKQLVVCCGGPTEARVSGFPALVEEIVGFPVAPVPTQLTVSSPDPRVDGELHLRNSLIGHMLARVVVLFFESENDYDAWVKDGVEVAFLMATQPSNRDKHFVVMCPQELPMQDIEILTGAGSISTALDWGGALNRLGDYTAPGFGGMVMIPSGEFGGIRIDKPFLISQDEVTQALYESAEGANPSELIGSNHPVDSISWFDMVFLSNALSGADVCYTNDALEDSKVSVRGVVSVSVSGEVSVRRVDTCTGFRLPTEREWEYAAMAFSLFEYSGGDDVHEVGWYAGNSNRQTHPVGQLKPNAFGTYDMSGNVVEWCWDSYREQGFSRVVRGGACRDDADHLRAAFRGLAAPASQYSDIGGRLARSIY